MIATGRLSLVTAPTVEPLSADDAAEHLKLTSRDEDEYLDGLISAARHYVETVTRRALITQTWDWSLDLWPQEVATEIPNAPLQSVTWIKYYAADDTLTTWASTNYQVSAPSGPLADPGRVTRVSGAYYPILRSMKLDAVTIRFVAGYGATADTVPQPIRTAMKFLVAEMYQRRSEVTVGTITTPNVMAANALLAPYRILRW